MEAERTFWGKATILHDASLRPADKPFRGRELSVQHVAERPGFVATVHRVRPAHLPARKRQELFRTEVLRRLGNLRVALPHHHNRAGVNVQPELDYSGASARLCLCIMIGCHCADSLALRAPLVRPMSSFKTHRQPARLPAAQHREDFGGHTCERFEKSGHLLGRRRLTLSLIPLQQFLGFRL